MSRLIVWRHGNTDWNASHRVQGQTDVPLNEVGRQQAVEAAELLVTMRPVAIISSDLARAADTAAALAAPTGLPVGFDKRLRERFFGEWQGHTTAEVAELWPDQYERWKQGHEVGGDVETLADLGRRVSDALREAAATAPPGGTVVVATHGSAARQGIGHLLRWPQEQLRTLRALQNCHWVELTDDRLRGWQIAAYNVGAFTDRPVPPPV